MRIISQYIARDIVAAIASVALILLLIILGKLFIQLLGEVLDGDLSANMLGAVLLLGVIRYLVILLPFSLFIAIILVLSRMYKDSEINAAMAGGASNKDLIKAVMSIGIPVLLAVYLLVSYISPWAHRLAEVIESVTEQSMVLGQLSPGKFFELESTGWVVYAESEDSEDGSLRNVFVQRSEGGKLVVEVAERAHIESDDEDLTQVFVLFDGKTIEGIPGQADYAISTYQEHRVYPPRTDFSREASKAKYQDLVSLFSMRDASYVAEIFQRCSIVFSTLVLMLLAIPLSKVAPNSGRFSRLAIAVLIYILYLNLVIVACSWIKRGESYGIFSLLSIHLIVVIGTVLAYQRDAFSRFKHAMTFT
ncbi:MAG: LPS export ABC transporter permease LptF [Gammaproteobacteria bacterium]|nr:LPS export ABC transporter permease LptF [Gammaproteobacteria bacterium]